MQAYIHNQTEKGSGIGKIGSVAYLQRSDKKLDGLDTMASNLVKHIAAMKPSFTSESDIPDKVR